MGWIWRDDEVETNKFEGTLNANYPQATTDFESAIKADRCATRRVVQSNCKTEEVEPGRFVRKCEKTEQVLKDCLGKPTEVVQSTKEYTEEDVTAEFSGSFKTRDSEIKRFEFPGLRNDIEAIERSLFGGFSSFFDAADEMKSEFFRVLDDLPLFGSESPSSSSASSRGTRGIPIEDHIQTDPATKPNDSGSADLCLSGLARDV